MTSGKTRSLLFFCTACLGICLFVLTATRVHAAIMVTYDLDSLVYLSSEIVEGRFIRWASREEEGIAEVELTAVYKGDLQPHQTITVAYLSPYVVGDLFEHHRSFKRGDDLILFLNPVTAQEAFNRLPAGRTYHGVIESGVKLVQGDRVLTFVQLMNPGPYGLASSSSDGPSSLPSAAEFRQSVAKSIPEMEQLRKRFAGKLSVADGPWLLELLRRPEEWDEDYLKDTAVDRISELHDLPLLARAAALPSGKSHADDLGSGYAFPAGREYLLKQIADPGLPKAERVRDACLLAGAGGDYDMTAIKIHSPHPGGSISGKRTGPPSEGNARYFSRIAGLAREFESDKELCGALLGSLKYLVQTTFDDDVQGQGIRMDRAGVLPIARKLAVTAKAKENRDEAQQVVNILLHPHS